MTKPSAGAAIALRCAVVRRGGKKPLLLAFNSKIELMCGVEVPIPTFCASIEEKQSIANKKQSKCFFMRGYFKFNY
jgi:hypothetical protein